MDFSIERFSGEKVRYLESEQDSSIQLVFIPGIYNPEIWKHQVKYFSEDFKTVSYGTDSESYISQEEILEDILDRENLRNTVLVTHGTGNTLAQAMEHREEVIATVLTGARKKARLYPRRAYKFSISAFRREPKLFKKLFFSQLSDYRVVRQFLSDVELPSYQKYESFARKYSLRKPIKNSMLVHATDDRFSSLSEARRFKPEASLRMIKDAGTFSFYEKPQDYNKALLEFLKNLENFVESREISQTREENRSLKDFVEV